MIRLSGFLRAQMVDGDGQTPSQPFDIYLDVAGNGRPASWLAFVAGVSAALLAWSYHSTLGKLLTVMLLPLAFAWFLGGVNTISGKRSAQTWRGIWMLAVSALGLAIQFALLLRKAAFTPDEFLSFPRAELVGMVGLVWLMCIAGPLLFQQRQAYRNELATLKLSAVTAELKALQAQVEPHFLYNTLANTRYLARHQPERAVDMLDHLIAYLHQALPDMRCRTSDATRECELARHYLALMAIRFGERMRYAVEVSEDAAQAEVPPLLLMSLVENAVRHGVEPMPGAVEVKVSAARNGEVLCLSVTDTGPGPGGTLLGSGVGLRNVRERLQALYGDRASFTLSRDQEDHQTRAELRLPFISAPARPAPEPHSPHPQP